MYINCLPSHNCLLKSEDKQFAQLVQVTSLLFFFLQSFSCVCSHLRVEAMRVIRLCLVHFTFWISHGLVVLLFSLLAEQAISLSYGISWKKNSKFCFSHRPPPPPHTHMHTHRHTHHQPTLPSPLLSLFLLPPPVSALSQLNLQNPMTGN